MEWPRLKNIILLIVVLVNLFLLVMNLHQAALSSRYEEEGRTGVIAVFEKNGIQLSEDAVPWDRALPSLTMYRDRDLEDRLAASMLGESDRTDRGNVSEYQSTGGTLLVSRTGEFSLTLDPALPAEDPARTAAPAYLKALGIDADVTESWIEEDRVVVRLLQNWNNIPIFNCEVEMEYVDNALEQISGTRLTGTPVSGGGEESLSDLTLLMRFLSGMNQLGDVCTQVEQITPGYGFTAGLADPILLTPEWYITTDTNEYYLNCLTGELTRAGK